MALPLSAEEQQRYSDIIDDILEKADLTTISRKIIVKELQSRIGKDTSEHKDAVKVLIVSRFDAVAEAAPSSKRSASEQATDDGTPTCEEEEDEDAQTPPKKKQKRASPVDTDAQLAARLQAQEDSRARSRSTRGAGTRATKDTKKKAPARRKKSAAKVRSDDDSDVEGGDGEKKKRAGGGFQKPFKLSPELSAVCGGEEQLSRPQVVKRLWQYIKGNELQDPADRRQINCDATLALVLGEKTNAFGMNKLLTKHLYPVEE